MSPTCCCRRAVGRRREVAVRLSLGANRSRLIRQLLTESMVLAAIAGAAGVFFAYWTSGVLMAFVPPIDMPIDLGLRHRSDDAAVCGCDVDRHRPGVRSRAGLADIDALTRARAERGGGQRHAAAADSAIACATGWSSRRWRSVSCCSSAPACSAHASSPRSRSRRASSRGTCSSPRWTCSPTATPRDRPAISPPAARGHHGAARRRVRVAGALCAARVRRNNSQGVEIDGYTPRPNEEINITYNTIARALFRDDENRPRGGPRIHRDGHDRDAGRAHHQRSDGPPLLAERRRAGRQGAVRQRAGRGHRHREGHRSTRSSPSRRCRTCSSR